MAQNNISNDPIKPLTLCAKCCKDPTLFEFVEKYRSAKAKCGYCGRLNICITDKKSGIQLNNLIRALIRFYYFEHEYNHHWGGDSQQALLSEENPVLENNRIKDLHVDDFFWDLAWPSYPNKGICIWAGYTDGEQNRLLNAISKSQSDYLRYFIQELSKRNHFELEEQLELLINKFKHKLKKNIEKNTIWYRCRSGVDGLYHSNSGGFDGSILSMPHQNNQIAAPPPLMASSGRMNRQGVSFLYIASDINTAVSEIRPHPGDKISVGRFTVSKSIKIADFESIRIWDFCADDNQLELFHLAYTLNKIMSTPVSDNEKHRYSVTQLLTDVLRKLGYKGVMYKSSVAEGTNLCMFEYSSFKQDKSFGEVIEAEELKYKLVESPSVLIADSDLYKLSPQK